MNRPAPSPSLIAAGLLLYRLRSARRRLRALRRDLGRPRFEAYALAAAIIVLISL
jgi:hypothetical protein